MRKSLAIVGAGRVGQALGRRLREAGWKIGAVVTRSESSARRAVRFIGAGRPFARVTADVSNSQTVLIATPDDTIAVVAERLSAVCGEALLGRIALHTSGARNAKVLEAVRKCGAAVGSMHPMQSFSGIKAPSLKGRIFAVEGDVAAIRVAKQIVNSLGGIALRVDGGKKALYHAGGVMAAGHALALVEAATRMLMASGISRKNAMRALLPLTRQVLDNFERLGPKAAWTGPLERRDFEVVRAHREALREMPKEFGAAYEALNRLAVGVLAENSGAKLRAGKQAPPLRRA